MIEETQQTLRIDYVEPTGSDRFVNGTVGGQKVLARIKRESAATAGEILPWRLDDAVAFDIETGKRI